MTNYTWLSVSTIDGHVIAEIPSVECSTLEVRMMEGTTATATIPWQDILTINWEEATNPFAAALLLVGQDNPDTPLWGGIIISRTRSLGSSTISLKLGTWEYLLAKYPVGDDSYTNTDQNSIVAQLVTKWAITGKNNSLEIAVSASTRKRDDTDHKESDNKSVLSCIQALAGVINGPEWYISWTRRNLAYKPLLTIADHIGSQNGKYVLSVDNLTEFSVNEAWEEGYAANTVQAYSSPASEENDAVQPKSQWYTYKDNTRPVLPYRFQPSTSITNIETLNQHAQAKLHQLYNGTTTVTISFALAVAPRLGIDWDLGDVLSWDLSEAQSELTNFTTGNVRFIGYTIDLSQSTLTPYLQNEGEIEW